MTAPKPCADCGERAAKYATLSRPTRHVCADCARKDAAR